MVLVNSATFLLNSSSAFLSLSDIFELYNRLQLNACGAANSVNLPSSNFERVTVYLPGTAIYPLSGSFHANESSNGTIETGEKALYRKSHTIRFTPFLMSVFNFLTGLPFSSAIVNSKNDSGCSLSFFNVLYEGKSISSPFFCFSFSISLLFSFNDLYSSFM